MMLDRSIAPKSYPIHSLKIDYPEKVAFDGIDGIIISDHLNEVVNLELIFDGERSNDQDKDLAFFAMKMLQEGTENKTAEQISYSFEALGSFFELSSGLEHSTIKVYSLKKHFGRSIELISELLEDSVFPKQEFTVLKNIRKTQIANQLAKNNQYATLKFNEIFFGPEHPFGSINQPGQVENISLENVISYYNHHLFSSPKFILSGSVGEHEINILKQALEKIRISNVERTPFRINSSWGQTTINREGSTQASVRIGAPTIDKLHPDIHKFTISNALLGGFFGSRLMKNVREIKGLTYGIYSTVVSTSQSDYWMIGSELANDKVDEALTEIDKEIETLANEKIDIAELDLLKNYLRGKLLTSLDSVFGKVAVFRNIFIHNLEFNYLNDYLETINAITAEAISDVISDYFLSKDRITLVVN